MSAYPTRDSCTELPSFAFVAQPWADRAVCAQADPEAWFPAKGRANRYAKAVCARCPVRRRCLDWAMATGQEFGVWGGLSASQRVALNVMTTGDLARENGDSETASGLTPKPSLALHPSSGRRR